MKVRSGAHFAQCESRSVAVLPYSRSGSGELRKTAPPGRDSMIVARVPNLRLLIDFVSMDARESPNAALGYLRNQEPCTRACDNRTMALRTADRDFMASLARGLSVILAFSAEGPRMTAAQLGVKTGLSRWAVRRAAGHICQPGVCRLRSPNRPRVRQRST